MAQSLYTSDLHEGHKNIGKFRRIPKEFIEMAEGDTTVANSLWIDHYWRKMVTKRDSIRCLGDNAFTTWGVNQIADRPGIKIQYGGNHDDLHVSEYLKAFSDIRGCESRRDLGWVSHFPLHPDELRGRFSIHGHVHYETIDDWRYINVCCDNLYENIGRPIITLDELRHIMDVRRVSKKVEYL